MFNKIVSSLIFAALLSGCNLNSGSLPQSDSFSLEKYSGTWRSQGYGYVFHINENGLRLFDSGKAGCLKNPYDSEHLAGYFSEYSQPDTNTMLVSAIKGASAYTFKRVPHKEAEELIGKCNHPPSATVLDNFDYFVTLMAEHYAFFDLHGADWQSLAQQERKKLAHNATQKTLYQSITSLLSHLPDAHIYLDAQVDGEARRYRNGHSRYLRPALDQAFSSQKEFSKGRSFRLDWYAHYQQQIKHELLTSANNPDFGGRILWGRLKADPKIGYINLLRMIGFSDTGMTPDEIKAAKQAMDIVMAELKDSRVIIVDVSANGGGEDEVSRLIAGYFTQSPVPAYQKQAHGLDTQMQTFSTKPALQHRFLGPVWLVTSDHTVSAAEIFVMSMMGLPNVTTVGDTTRGALSDVLEKSLPNGWQLGLSNEEFRDAKGRLWEGKGIPAAEPMPVFRGPDIHNSHLKAIQKLTNKIKSLPLS